jgi:hypothetical protein
MPTKAACRLPEPSETIRFILRALVVTFLGYYRDGRFWALTEDSEEIFFEIEEVDTWEYAGMPDRGEVAIWEEN